MAQLAIGHHRVEDFTSGVQAGVRYLVPLGRLLFAGIFLLSAPHHFQAGTIGYAAHHGVPLAHVLVPASGVLALLGGLSIALGFHARIGAALLVAFLVPVTFAMHNFWAVSDPAQAQMQLVNFMKNLGLLGGALCFMYFGAGPISLDRRPGASR